MGFVICVTGLPGSGKSTVASILRRKGFAIVEMGGIVKEMMVASRLDTSGSKIRDYSTKMRTRHGGAVFAKYASQKALDYIKRGKNAAIVGLRNTYEIEFIRKKLGRGAVVLLVGVFAPKSLRFKRLMERGRGDDSNLRAKMEERDRQERNGYLAGGKGKRRGTEALLQSSDYLLFNTNSKMQLYKDANLLISKIKGSKA
ncbi:MAG: AAA family ATPase [Candidatus Micrarchaeota archaeon]|nr:AAA family ATPase [Candidatus Micrarchaeota archaeon]MDE1804378.1 AAA family ATPase [Candidatus Micrarchaeota archaeon]MDE1846622.1 AAA family ATPase [Candidatus Micrarchaeota archaeon]